MCLYKKAFALIFSAAVCFDLLLQDSATSSLPPNVTEGKKEAATVAAEPCAGIPADKQHQQSCPHTRIKTHTLLSPVTCRKCMHTHTRGPIPCSATQRNISSLQQVCAQGETHPRDTFPNEV